MKVTMYTNNHSQWGGKIHEVKEYSKDKAANITLIIDNGKDENGNNRPGTFLQLKCFVPAVYNLLKKDMKVMVYGHVKPNSYEKNGEKVYNNDLIADYVEFLETKKDVDLREAAKAAD